MVRQIEVPDEARAFSTLERIDYADAFVRETGEDRSAEEWARAVLEGAPLTVRGRLLSGWTSLGLKLGDPHAPDTVLGWAVREATPDHVLLHADSRIGMPGELLFLKRAGGLLFSTFVRFGNPVARAVWGRVEGVHVRTVRGLLE